MRKIPKVGAVFLTVAILISIGTSARATTVSYTTSTPIPSTLTDWTGSLTFQQFDPSLGTLTSVELILYSEMDTTFTVKNNGSSSSSGDVQTRLRLSVSGGNITGAPQISVLFPASPFSFNLTPGETITSGPYTATGSSDLTYTDSSVLAAFTGPGTITLAAGTITRTLAEFTGGNPDFSQTTHANFTGTVIYHYTSVPEPSTMLLLGIGLIGMAVGVIRFKK